MVQSHKHGGSRTEKVGAAGASKCVTPYGMDTSDYNGGSKELVGAKIPMGADGVAGGYDSTSRERGNGGGRKSGGGSDY